MEKLSCLPIKCCTLYFQGEIEKTLRTYLNHGKVFPECAIFTNKGTKVADVVWASDHRFKKIKNEIECSIAPEICIEIFSASNSMAEMEEKKILYLEQGAEEFWLCNEEGGIDFFGQNGQPERSSIVPDFPNKINL